MARRDLPEQAISETPGGLQAGKRGHDMRLGGYTEKLSDHETLTQNLTRYWFGGLIVPGPRGSARSTLHRDENLASTSPAP